ncbi:MAG: cytochrome ubiquinol oxidase subunit I, partial [Chlamydiota bacterium]|nr:cytochrome ubiquinol oxidase subunit I [Chlamydiota bacterium]
MPPINFPLFGNSLVMAIVILIHVFFAFIAVGGILIATASDIIGRITKNPYYDRIAKGYILFLSDLMKLGGVLGVLIVILLIGLFPEFSKVLYHIFFWPLLGEMFFFFLLMASTICYRHGWEKGNRSPWHLFCGITASCSAVIAAVIINAMQAFMLSPGNYFQTNNIIDAVFNPTMWASSTHLLIPCVMNAAVVAFLFAWYRTRRATVDNRPYFEWLSHYTGNIAAACMLIQPLSGMLFLLRVRSVHPGVFTSIIQGPVSPFFWTMATLGITAFSCAILYNVFGNRARPLILIGGL